LKFISLNEFKCSKLAAKFVSRRHCCVQKAFREIGKSSMHRGNETFDPTGTSIAQKLDDCLNFQNELTSAKTVQSNEFIQNQKRLERSPFICIEE
jgi:hypothetical protein